jgi:hypothetical protein
LWSRATNALDRFPILMLLYFPIVQSSYGKSPSHLMSAMYSRFLRWQSPEESHIPLASSLPFVPRSCLNWISYSDKPSTISRKAGPLVPRSEHFFTCKAERYIESSIRSYLVNICCLAQSCYKKSSSPLL